MVTELYTSTQISLPQRDLISPDQSKIIPSAKIPATHLFELHLKLSEIILFFSALVYLVPSPRIM